MKLSEVLDALENAGTAQNRKIYARHGVLGKAFGVSYAELGRLTRVLRQNHALAVGLWRSGWHDARVLATSIADPSAMKASELEAWAKEVDNDVLGRALAGLVARSQDASKLMRKWIRSKSEAVSSMGYTLMALLSEREEQLADEECEDHLGTIEKGIHSALNRTRYSMNTALIAIGSYRSRLTEKAIAAARRIGKVEVDHGETSCKTPDAEPYIKKTAAHRAKKAAKKATTRPTKKTASKKTGKKQSAKKKASSEKTSRKKAPRKQATKKAGKTTARKAKAAKATKAGKKTSARKATPRKKVVRKAAKKKTTRKGRSGS